MKKFYVNKLMAGTTVVVSIATALLLPAQNAFAKVEAKGKGVAVLEKLEGEVGKEITVKDHERITKGLAEIASTGHSKDVFLFFSKLDGEVFKASSYSAGKTIRLAP